MTYEVPGNKVGAIIGPRGATIRQIREETNCNIEIPPRDFSVDNVEVKIISFAGSKADALKVIEMIKKIVSGIPLFSVSAVAVLGHFGLRGIGAGFRFSNRAAFSIDV
jgi:polyribonucleotide nucleotidyltransferase